MNSFKEFVFKNFAGSKVVANHHESDQKDQSFIIIVSSGTNNLYEEELIENIIKGCMGAFFSVIKLNLTESIYEAKEIESYTNSILGTLSSLIDWIFNYTGNKNLNLNGIWISAFDLITYPIANIAMRRPEIEGFIMINVPYRKYNYNFFSPTPCHGLILNLENKKDDLKKENLNASIEFKDALIERGIHKIDFESLEITQVADKIHEYLNFQIATKVYKPIKKRRRKRRKAEAEGLFE
jgi:hypothetical protein